MMYDRLIITAASSGYEASLFALIGSINCNWPNHPPLLVYDLGLSTSGLSILEEHGIPVRKIPQFVDHWRSDFTWKFWCFKDAPAKTYLWIDAGMCVFSPLDETFTCAERLGYFAVALYNHPVLPSVPKPLQRNSGLKLEKIADMVSISSGIHSIHKNGNGLDLVEEGFALAMNQENLRATEPPHRHDQALLTLLLNKHFDVPVLADYHIYAHHFPTGPGIESRQKIWVHRRKMQPSDIEYFKNNLAGDGVPYKPKSAIQRVKPTLMMKVRVLIAKLRGRYPGDDVVRLDEVVLRGVKD